MPLFTYKVLQEDGTTSEGTTEAKDRFDVYNIVRREGGAVLSVKEEKKSTANVASLVASFSSVSTTEKINVMRNLGAMIKAGLSMSRALATMERQTRNEALRSVLHDLQNEIQRGGELHTAMLKHPKVFSPLVVAMVKAGEESGSLVDALLLISEQMKRSYELKKKIRGAMIYPSIIVTVLFLVGVLMMIYIVPTLTETFRELNVELPLSTQAIIFVSEFLKNHILIGIGIFLAVVVGFVSLLRTSTGKQAWEFTLLHLPVVGTMAKETNAARTGRTLSSLLKSGVHVIDAFQITEDVLQNSYYKKVIRKAIKRVQTGAPIAQVFVEEERLYPPLVGELIAVGEETGNLPDMLLEIAVFYESEVDQKTKNLSTIVEPVLMLVVGAAVGYFAVAMISPIYSVATNF